MRFHFDDIVETTSPQTVEMGFTTSGQEDPQALENVQIHIHEVTPLRDFWKMSLGIGRLPSHGVQTRVKADIEKGLYAISGVTSNGLNTQQPSVNHEISGKLWFDVPLTLSESDAQMRISYLHKERETLATKITTAKNATEGSPLFAAIIYYSGVHLHFPFLLEGAEIYPVPAVVDIKLIEQPLSADLERLFKQKILFPPQVKIDYEANASLFAVRLFRIRAIDYLDARAFALEFADTVAKLIAIERGEKPSHYATFVGGDDGIAFYPAFLRSRENLAPPMFSNSHANLVEAYQPVMRRSDYARLLITLFAEAIGERDMALQHFRCWAIIEQIAKK